MCCCPTCGSLEEQDHLIQKSITSNDYLAVSIGGNDIALAPSLCTIFFLLCLMLTPMCFICSYHPAMCYFIW